MLTSDRYNQVPRSVAVRIGGKVRAGNKDGRLCCSSCHEDHEGGYFEHSESWRYDEAFKDGRKAEDRRKLAGKKQPPWGLQFCCCAESIEFERQIENWLKEREVVNA